MKAFLLAIIAVAAIGVGSAVILQSFQQNADTSFSGIGTRLEKHDVDHGAKPKG